MHNVFYVWTSSFIVSKRFAMELIRYKMIRYVKMLPAGVLTLLRYGRIFVITMFVTHSNFVH